MTEKIRRSTQKSDHGLIEELIQQIVAGECSCSAYLGISRLPRDDWPLVSLKVRKIRTDVTAT
jgi:hypothetical protein